MHTLSAIASSEADAEDALKVLGRVADAFDNPSMHKTDKELKLFMVNVVKSHHLLPSFSSEESMCQDDSSFDVSCDEDGELGDVRMWEHAAAYPYVPRLSQRHRERNVRQDQGTYEVTKMLLTSSPLDRLDRLARMELRKTGWIERVDKWTIVEMGLQGVPQTPKTPSKDGSKMERPCTPRRAEMGRRGYDTPPCQTSAIKATTPVSMGSTVDSEESPCLSTLSYGKLGRRSRFLQAREQTRGRLGQAVRNIVKRMLPPSSVGESDVSWSSGSASSWMEARGWSRH